MKRSFLLILIAFSLLALWRWHASKHLIRQEDLEKSANSELEAHTTEHQKSAVQKAKKPTPIFNPNKIPSRLASTSVTPTATDSPETLVPLATATAPAFISTSPNPSPLPPESAPLQALREIERTSNDQSRRISGLRSSSSGNAQSSNAEPTASPSPAPTEFARLNGQARGYLMLPLMHPAARLSSNRQIDALLRAEIDNIYLGVLSDGTFAKDFAYLQQVLKKLSVDGRAVILVLYLTNGATQRDFESTPISAAFNLIDPFIFRELIQHDFPIRDQFSRMMKEVKSTFELNRSLSPRARNIAIPMLEDNLDFESYRAMRNMMINEFGSLVTIMRNPCPGCYKNNDMQTLGEKIELHKPSDLAGLGSGDGFTLDGVGYRYQDEAPSSVPSLDDVKALIERGIEQKLAYFGLWREDRQGRSGPNILHPDQRNYAVPSEAQLQADIELLRHALP